MPDALPVVGPPGDAAVPTAVPLEPVCAGMLLIPGVSATGTVEVAVGLDPAAPVPESSPPILRSPVTQSARGLTTGIGRQCPARITPGQLGRAAEGSGKAEA